MIQRLSLNPKFLHSPQNKLRSTYGEETKTEVTFIFFLIPPTSVAMFRDVKTPNSNRDVFSLSLWFFYFIFLNFSILSAMLLETGNSECTI